MHQPLGPVIMDLTGPELSSEEGQLLRHPLVGGVILFARNYQSPEQLTALCRAIRQQRAGQPILIGVDQEGGRVQRCQVGFTRLPSMGRIGQLFDREPTRALRLALDVGWVMAQELLVSGIDLSFAPVLDLNKGLNTVIGDRAFHADPGCVIQLAGALIQGMQQAGMAATGKHFPGHGHVTVDTHLNIAEDARSFATIQQEDLLPFKELRQFGLSAIMPAHIIYSAIDKNPVGFSAVWLQNILRQELGFTGLIFSDDLNMAGAAWAGNYVDRAHAALQAGCNMILMCNNRPAVLQLLSNLPEDLVVPVERWQPLRGTFSQSWAELKASSAWQQRHTAVVNAMAEWESLT